MMSSFLAGFIAEIEKLATPITGQDAPITLHHSKTSFGAPDTGGPQNSGAILGPDGKLRSAHVDQQPGRPTHHEPEKLANDPIKKRVTVHGIGIGIEWKKGETRKYYDKKDPKKVDYEKKMHADYGYIGGTKDHDGEQLDVYVGPNPKSKKVFVIKQLKDDGSFDEHKVMLGYNNLEEAKKGFLDHMPPKRLGAVEETDVDSFKKKHLVQAKEMSKAAASRGTFLSGFSNELVKLVKLGGLLRERIREGGSSAEGDEFMQARHLARLNLPAVPPGVATMSPTAARQKRWTGASGSADARGQQSAPKGPDEIAEPMVSPASTAADHYAS